LAIPYKECKQGVEPQQYNETKLNQKKFIEKSCTVAKKTIPHKKLVPRCTNITKQNCVTIWEIDQSGKQVRKTHCIARSGLGLMPVSQ
jgi:hypothetical protein